jgi:hypothetical protein
MKKIFLFINLFFCLSCLGDIQKFDYAEGDILNIDISNKYNFLSIRDLEVKEIVGDNTLYDIHKPTSNQKIVFIPKTLSPIKLSIISNTGLVQDMVLNVKNLEPRSIEITMPLPHKALPVDEYSKIDTKDFISRILSNREQFEPLKKREKHRTKTLRYARDGYFKKLDIIADSYRVSNRTKKPLNVTDVVKEITPNYLDYYSKNEAIGKYSSADVLIVRRVNANYK